MTAQRQTCGSLRSVSAKPPESGICEASSVAREKTHDAASEAASAPEDRFSKQRQPGGMDEGFISLTSLAPIVAQGRPVVIGVLPARPGGNQRRPACLL